MGDSRPIGLFDSGVGGLTVAREVFRCLPGEAIVYFGDTARVPYGPRKKEELIRFAREIISFLIAADVKYIIFACGTNSSLTLPFVRGDYAVPMIGLVEPGAKEAVQATQNGRIGVIATEATVKSGAYQRVIRSLAPEAEIFAQAAPRLVPLVEAGRAAGEEARRAVFAYARPLREAGTDTLILGCTHYPFLAAHFRECLGPAVRLIDPAAATVLEARREMEQLGLLNEPAAGNDASAAGGEAGATIAAGDDAAAAAGAVRHSYYVSGDPAGFIGAARRLGYRLETVRRVLPAGPPPEKEPKAPRAAGAPSLAGRG